MSTRKPPPLPNAFPPDPKTPPQGIEYRAAMLVKFWAGCDEYDRAYLMGLAEKMCARNAKKD